MRLLAGLAVFAILLGCRIALAQSSEPRVALVIGNGAYEQSPLRNPVNDARDMSARLRQLGFVVIERSNLRTRDIGSTLREFRSRLVPGAVALVFYAGHGLQIRGENYLPAVDARIDGEEDVPNQSLAMRQVMDVLADSKARLNLVFLDACRDNPYARSFRTASRGLSRENAPSGTLISFATRPGGVAADGDIRNGLYTSALLAAMNQTQQPIEQVLKAVVTTVKARSKNQQEPWMEGSIEGEFCFGTCAVAGPTTAVPASVSPRVESAVEREDRFWEDTKAAGNREAFEAYRRAYPQGRYAGLALANINRLPTSPSISGTDRPRPSRPRYDPFFDSSPSDDLTASTAAKDAAAEAVEATKKRYASTAPTPPSSPGRANKDCDTCPEMVSIPAGTFVMGSAVGEGGESERPQRKVSLHTFAIGRYEVTQAQWQAVMGNNPSRFKGTNRPVEQVSWDEAQEYVRRLSAKTGRSYRLPSEAEWEYVALAGSEGRYSFGNDASQLREHAWFAVNSSGSTQPVGQKRANRFGLHDLHGNVWEWIQDCWNANYSGASPNSAARLDGDCSRRVVRGGSWYNSPETLRAANRGGYKVTLRLDNFGLRVARDN